MDQKYKGVIIEESLEDKSILKNFEIISQTVSENLGWHIDTVLVSESDFEKLAQIIKRGTWYMHFWVKEKMVAIFYGKIFSFDFNDKTSWEPVLKYGLSLGIPEEQLDFPIDDWY